MLQSRGLRSVSDRDMYHEEQAFERRSDPVWILVVENDAPMGELLRQGLEEQNHAVTLARDGIEGLHAAKTSNFDAIVLDVMMPGMDGIEVARRLRGAGQKVPIIMLAARAAPSDMTKGRDARAG